ncbi:MAG: YggS family pyridoxal phosphate-dependent enzyme [Oscillospiraceae bacterium]|nr:YggS family pyridoxal phosphate-dependent enzyme [Oscillospiraceae bacterium]
MDENYKRITYNMQEAAAKYRRADEVINLMAVTKTVDPVAVNHAIGLGISLLGENRVQEYTAKKDLYNKNAQVHFIGHLQTNKVKYIIDSVSVIQSVDSLKLAQEIDRHAKRISKTQDILIEVNIGGEESKSGTDKAALNELIYSVSELQNVRIKGLMAIPPIESPEKFLYEMQGLYIDISEKNIHNVSMEYLSMGMSGDYEDAIKYGSNIIRIGRGLFGPRNYF